MGQAEAVRALLAPDADLWFLIGFDKVAQIFDPRYYTDRDVALRALFAATRLAVMPRDADSQEALGSLLGRAENQEYAHRVAFVNMPPELAAVSSSVARELLARAGNPPRVDPELAADLLAPEGAALALVTGAYSPPARSPDGRLVDLYADRTAALAAVDPDDALRAADAVPRLPST